MISIISLNWNTSNLLIGLYESVKKNTIVDFEFIVIDNGSCELEESKFAKYVSDNSEIKYFRNDVNIGFAAGNNIGMKHINNDSEHVFFINSDIVVNDSNWIEKFFNVLDNEKVGIVGCAYHPLKWDVNANFHIQPITSEPVKSESVQGAFFGIKKKILDEVYEKDGHWFDEEFRFAHYEETDLCFRIMKSGYECIWVPVLHEHLHSQSATKKNGYKLTDGINNEAEFKANSNRNKQLLLKKHTDFLKNK